MLAASLARRLGCKEQRGEGMGVADFLLIADEGDAAEDLRGRGGGRVVVDAVMSAERQCHRQVDEGFGERERERWGKRERGREKERREGGRARE